MPVKYVNIGLGSLADYWQEIVNPSVKEFYAAPSSRSAFQAALAVWHLHDWVWYERYPGQSASGAAYDATIRGCWRTAPNWAAFAI
jgi:hypothetical protein